MTTYLLKADASAGDAYAEFDFGSNEEEVWYTFSLLVAQPALDLWESGSNIVSLPALTLATTTSNEYINIADPMAWGDLWVGNFGQGSIPPPVAGSWMVCEWHFVRASLEEFYVNGSLVWSAGGGITHLVDGIQAGVQFGPADAASIAYYKDIKAGTTRGGNDLADIDMSDGTLDAWTTTVGDVSAVPGYTPIPPPTVTYSRVYGIQITLSDDGVEQVAQLVTSQDGFAT